MIKTAVFGCRDGEYVYNQLEKGQNSLYQIEYFCDNDASLNGFTTDGIPVVSADTLREKYKEGRIDSVIVAVRNGYNRWFITDQLVNKGINREDIGWVKPSVLTYNLPITFYETGEDFYRKSSELCEIKGFRKSCGKGIMQNR